MSCYEEEVRTNTFTHKITRKWSHDTQQRTWTVYVFNVYPHVLPKFLFCLSVFIPFFSVCSHKSIQYFVLFIVWCTNVARYQVKLILNKERSICSWFSCHTVVYSFKQAVIACCHPRLPWSQEDGKRKRGKRNEDEDDDRCWEHHPWLMRGDGRAKTDICLWFSYEVQFKSLLSAPLFSYFHSFHFHSSYSSVSARLLLYWRSPCHLSLTLSLLLFSPSVFLHISLSLTSSFLTLVIWNVIIIVGHCGQGRLL